MTFVDTPELEFRYEACEGKYTPPFSVFERTVSILLVLTVLVHHPMPISLIQAQTKGVTTFVFFLPSFPNRQKMLFLLPPRVSQIFTVFSSPPQPTLSTSISSLEIRNVSSILFSQALVPLPRTLHSRARDDPLHADWLRSLPY